MRFRRADLALILPFVSQTKLTRLQRCSGIMKGWKNSTFQVPWALAKGSNLSASWPTALAHPSDQSVSQVGPRTIRTRPSGRRHVSRRPFPHRLEPAEQCS